MIRRGDLFLAPEKRPKTIQRPYDLQYDHNGFRNGVDYVEADCIVIGDSFIEGFHVTDEELHTTQVADTLGISVVNFGQSGYGPQQELLVLQRYGLPLQPKVCLWVFFEGNDLQDALRYKQMLADWPDSVALYSSVVERSFTKNLHWWLSRLMIDQGQRESESGLFLGDGKQTRLWFGYSGSPMSDAKTSALSITEASLSRAFALCQDQGVAMAVIFAPTKYRVYSKLCEFESPSRIENWTVNRLPEMLAERVAAISSEIAFYDMTPDLQRVAQQGNLLYFEDDSHWSPQGHRVAAQAICSLLRERFGHLLAPDNAGALRSN